MKRITVTLTEDQQDSLINLLSDTIHDFDDYSFDDQVDQKALDDEKAFYVRLLRQISK
jgi:hypothetical protein